MAGADDAQLKDFQGLPISELIVDPLVSASAGQKKLAGVTLEFVSSIGQDAITFYGHDTQPIYI